MTDKRFSGWALVLFLAIALGIAAASLFGGLFLGYQWGRSAGRSQVLAEFPRNQGQPNQPFDDQLPPRGAGPQFREQAHAFLGVAFRPITPELAEEQDLPVEHGALITQVVIGSPAEQADLRQGDVILGVNGRAVDDDHPLPSLIQRFEPGDDISLEVLRGRRRLTVEVTLGSQPPEGFFEPDSLGRFGLRDRQMLESFGQDFPGLHFQFRCDAEPCFFFEDQR